MSGTPRLPALRGGYLSVEKDPEREAARERRRRSKMMRARGRWGLIRSNLKAEVQRLKDEFRQEMEADRRRVMENHRMRQLLLRLSGKEDFSAWRAMAHDIHPLCSNFFSIDELCVHLAVHEGDLDAAAMAILEDTPPYRAVREAVEDRLMHKDGVVFAGQRLEAMTLDEAVRAMTDPEDENKSITHLNLRFVQVGDDGAAVIGAALSKTVQELGTKQNRIKKRLSSAKAAAEASAPAASKYDVNDANTYCSVTHLKLSHNGITDFGAGMIASALKTPQCQVSSLELKKNPLGTDGAKYIAKALEDKHNKLTELTLGLTGMGREGVARLCVALTSSHCKLERLNLFCTQIGDVEAGSIARALASGECRSLTELVLPGTSIGTKGVSYLAQALSKPEACRLVTLNLEFNSRVGAEGAAHLAAALKTTWSRRETARMDSLLDGGEADDVDGNDDDMDASAACCLTSLSLRGNCIGDLGAQCLASAIRSRRCRLLELNVEYNHIGEEGTLAIAKALHADHCSLMRLHVFGNAISVKAQRLIAKAMIFKATQTEAEKKVNTDCARCGTVDDDDSTSNQEDEDAGTWKHSNKTYMNTTLMEDHEDKVSTVATSITSTNDIVKQTIANDSDEMAQKQILKEEAEAATEAAYERWMRGSG